MPADPGEGPTGHLAVGTVSELSTHPLPFGTPLVVHGGHLVMFQNRALLWCANGEVADHIARLLDEHGLVSIPDTAEGIAP